MCSPRLKWPRHLSVGAFLKECGELWGQTPKLAQARASASLEQLGITGLFEHPMSALSPLDEALVSLGRALLTDPATIAIDRPTLGLEGAQADEYVERLMALAPRHDRILTLSDTAWSAAERRLLLSVEQAWLLGDGQLLARDTPTRLLGRSRRYLLTVLGDPHAVRARLAGAGVHVSQDLGPHVVLAHVARSPTEPETAESPLGHRWVFELPEGGSNRDVLAAIVGAEATLIELRPLGVGALQDSP